MEVAKLTSYVFYDATIVTNMGIRNYPRLAMVATKPMTHSMMPFGARQEDLDSTTGKMLAAAGMQFWHRLDGDAFIAVMSGTDSEGNSSIEIMRGPASVASHFADHYAEEDLVPKEVMEQMFPREEFREGIAIVDKTMTDVMECALGRLNRMRENNAKHGFTDSAEHMARLAEMAEQLAPIAKRVEERKADPASLAIIDAIREGKEIATGTPMPKALVAPNGILNDAMGKAQVDCGIHNGADIRFVGVDATDFRKVAVSAPGGFKGMDYIRVFHCTPPEWRPRKDTWPEDVLGCWFFKDAAVGEVVEVPGTAREMIGYVSMANLAVLVKDADAIAPAGQMAVPEFIWQQLNPGKEPTKTMDEDEGLAFNNSHAVPLDMTEMRATARTLN